MLELDKLQWGHQSRACTPFVPRACGGPICESCRRVKASMLGPSRRTRRCPENKVSAHTRARIDGAEVPHANTGAVRWVRVVGETRCEANANNLSCDSSILMDAIQSW